MFLLLLHWNRKGAEAEAKEDYKVFEKPLQFYQNLIIQTRINAHNQLRRDMAFSFSMELQH